MNKKTIYSLIGAIALILAIGVGTTYAKDQIKRNNVISLTAAKNFAFVDAGISENEVSNLEVELEKEFGAYYYDVDFLVNGKSYSYHIDATNGKVIAKELPLITEANTSLPENKVAEVAKKVEEKVTSISSNNINVTPKENTQKKAEEATTTKDTEKPKINLSPYLSIEKIKDITLKDSGVNKKEAIFETTKLDREDGRDIYEVEFFTGDTEHDYEIDAHTGEILRHSKEAQNKLSPTLIKEKQEIIKRLERFEDNLDDMDDDFDDDDFDDDSDFDDDDNDDND